MRDAAFMSLQNASNVEKELSRNLFTHHTTHQIEPDLTNQPDFNVAHLISSAWLWSGRILQRFLCNDYKCYVPQTLATSPLTGYYTSTHCVMK